MLKGAKETARCSSGRDHTAEAQPLGKLSAFSIFDAHESKGPSEQGHVLGELDHFSLALLRVLYAPEIVHNRRYSQQKSRDGGRSELRLDSENKARAAQGESNSGSGYSGIWRGHVLRGNVLRHLLVLNHMVDPVVEEEPTEYQASEHVGESHKRFSRNIRED
jgi:hypothetical protein